jgi:hypothetical protein
MEHIEQCPRRPVYHDEATETGVLQMNTSDISALARHLFETKGPQAIAEAAQKAVHYESAGDEAQAKEWRRVEAALREMRGPRES